MGSKINMHHFAKLARVDSLTSTWIVWH